MEGHVGGHESLCQVQVELLVAPVAGPGDVQELLGGLVAIVVQPEFALMPCRLNMLLQNRLAVEQATETAQFAYEMLVLRHEPPDLGPAELLDEGCGDHNLGHVEDFIGLELEVG